ncbi:MAG: hypothetical protein IJ491_03335 [Clostridia bacterium]|nr:hypothetical protein [Clostridia bacterium]
MNKEMKRLFGKFFFVNVIIACMILFCCGCITAKQRTSYNAYLREYAVLSMKSEGERVKMEGLSREIAFTLPQKQEIEKLGRYLKLTPLASTVFFIESADAVMQEIFHNVLT